MGILSDGIITRIALEAASIIVIDRSVIATILDPGRVVGFRSAGDAERVPECHLVESGVAGCADIGWEI